MAESLHEEIESQRADDGIGELKGIQNPIRQTDGMKHSKCQKAENVIDEMVWMDQIGPDHRGALNGFGGPYPVPIVVSSRKEQI